MSHSIKLKSGEVLEVRELPEGHRIEYLARSVEDRKKFYLVHAPHLTEETAGKFPDYYGSFGLYLGNPNAMQEAKVNEVTRWRDGGTTQIFYTLENKEGQLYFPAPRREEKASDHFDGKTVKLEQLVRGRDF